MLEFLKYLERIKGILNGRSDWNIVEFDATGDIGRWTTHVCDFIGELRHHITHDVYQRDQYKGYLRIFGNVLQELERKKEGKYFSISFHKIGQDAEHVHVIHSCVRYNGSCKCFISRYVSRFGPPKFRKIFKLDNKEGIRNLVRYIGEPKHGNYFHFLYRTKTGGSVLLYYNLPITEDQADAPQRLVANQGEGNKIQFPEQFERCEISESERNFCYGASTSTGTGTSGYPSREKYTFEEILSIIENNLTSPLEKIIYTPEWTSSMQLIKMKEDVLETYITAIRMKILRMSVLDIYNFINNAKNVYFGAFIEPVDDFYYDIDQSLQIVNDVLLFQFDGCKIKIRDFLHDIYYILNKRKGKYNALSIVGPPTSFKSTFIKMISSFMLTTGFITSINKYNVFGLQNCKDKRLVVFDDCKFDPGQIETLKALFSGDDSSVSVKYKQDFTLPKTPFIIIANNDEFKHSVWENRIIKYNWKTYNKIIEKQLYPLCFIELLKEYKIINI